MEHWIAFPILFQPFNRQPLEQLLLAFEVVFKRGNQQALSETSRAAQEVNAPLFHHTINQGGLVYINITSPYYLSKILYSYRVFHVLSVLSILSFRKLTHNYVILQDKHELPCFLNPWNTLLGYSKCLGFQV